MATSNSSAVLLAALAAAPFASAQKATFSSDVSLVYVTVTVTDGKGQPVHDLKASEFTLSEDGKPRPIELFAVGSDEAAVPDVALLVDTSGSVSTHTEKMTFEALRILERIPKVKRSLVLSFDNDVRVWRADAGAGSLVRDIMTARRENGATALNTALVTALQQLPDPAPRSTMILLSDGEDVGSRVTTFQAVEALKRSRVTIYPMTHGVETPLSMPHGNGVANWGQQHRHGGADYLKRLAAISGGRVFTPDDGSFEAAVDAVIGEVEAQYVVGFAPSNPTRAGNRKLKLQIARPDLKARYRDAYFLEPQVKG